MTTILTAAHLAAGTSNGLDGAVPAAVSRWSRSLPIVLAVVFAAFLVTARLVIGSVRRPDPRRELAALIERYGSGRASTSAEGGGKVAQAAIGWMRRLLRSTSAEARLAVRLDQAGTARQPAEWTLMGVCVAAVLAAVLSLATRNAVIGVLLAALIGWLGMRLILSIRIGRRRAAFGEQLPDVLQLVAGSLQSGFSLQQALDAMVREDTQPAAGEFSRALAEARIGADLEAGLEGVAYRMNSDDLQWTVMAIRIQREVGGNLAEVLRTTVDTMRERAYIRRHVKALSAEGRFSAYILAALPVAVSGWMLLVARTYTRPLYTTVIGLVMVAVAAVLFLLGVLWLRAVIKVEV